MIKNFEDLEVWKEGRQLTRHVYSVSKKGAFAKDFGLKDQIRRAAVSITSNIAEGFERNANKQFLYFLSIAKSSAGEVRSQLYVALDEGYINQETFDILYEQASKTISKIGSPIRYLQNHHSTR